MTARMSPGSARKLAVTPAKDLTGGYIKALKARRQEVGVWELRGKVLSRVMVAARDARLSGGEWGVLATITLHLHHMGRSKGMMTVAKLADDAGVTERTVRNVLRVLVAIKFIRLRHRHSGQVEVLLDRRFNAKSDVPGDKSACGERRRCVPRKKISTTRNSNVPLSFLVTDECTDSAPATARRESPAAVREARTANDNGAARPDSWGHSAPEALRAIASALEHTDPAYAWPDHGPPRKRAAPASPG